MNPEYEKQLAASVQRELDMLGELRAPPTLAGRVMRVIEGQVAPPWYHRAWQTWPPALQGVSLVALLVLFSGICFGVVELSQAARGSAAGRQVGEWFAELSVFWKTANTLVGAIETTIQHLGSGFVVVCVLAMAMAYAACIGLGTAYVRLAWAQR